jgi:hypothetical protein
MSLRYVLFRENSSSHEEEYLARADHNSFVSVEEPAETNLQFDTAAEGYEFAKNFPQLQYWRVGQR